MRVLDDFENMMVERVEAAFGRVLTEDEKYEVLLWDRGRTLAPHVQTESWTVILRTIKNYVEDAAEALIDMKPGDPLLTETHAMAYVLDTFYKKFQEDIFRAINAPMPQCLRKAVTNSQVPPESL
jgi:hypothetical protein